MARANAARAIAKDLRDNKEKRAKKIKTKSKRLHN